MADDEQGNRGGLADIAAETEQNISLAIEGPVATIRLTRTSKLNPLNWATICDLRQAIEEIESRADIKVAVITGSGRSFSAGGDLGGYLDLYCAPEKFSAFLEDFWQLFDAMERSRLIFVAAVNGICVAGGLELILACDLVVASEDARIGDGHLNFGQLPGAGGSQRLPRAIGALRAKYLILTGKLIDAQEALSLGLICKIFPAATFEEDVRKLVSGLMSKSPAGLSGAKHLVNHAGATSLEEGLRYEIDFVHNYATTHPDAMEGLIAFRDKREPEFKV